MDVVLFDRVLVLVSVDGVVRQSIGLGIGRRSCCCVSGSDVAAIMLQLCLVLMGAVTIVLVDTNIN